MKICLKGGARDLRDLLEANAHQGAGVAGQLLPGRAQDIARNDAPQDLAGGGHQQVGQAVCRRGTGHSGGGTRGRAGAVGAARGRSGGGACRGRGAGGGVSRHNAGDEALQVRIIHGQIFHIVQHAVAPQVAGHIVQDEPVDLSGIVDGIVANIEVTQCYPPIGGWDEPSQPHPPKLYPESLHRWPGRQRPAQWHWY